MKKFLFVSSILGSMIILAACQPAAPAGQTTTQETKKTGTMTTSSVPITSEQPVQLEINSFQINITKDGFSPKELEIKKGVTVVFYNEDDRSHWPASDDHPTHTDCPGLDALKPLLTGEAFEFTFKEPIVCGIHDHMDPTITGTITVTE